MKFYNTTKGFGFVIEDGASPDEKGAFVHATVLEKMGRQTGSPVIIKDGDAVEYEAEEGERGLNVTSIKLA